MSSSNLYGTIGNTVSRLQGLKNVNKRIIPGAEFLNDLEDAETDVSDTSSPLPQFNNFKSPSENLPESDLGGELTSQSYDVRANSVIDPSKEEKSNNSSFFSRLGSALADYVNPQKREEMTNRNQALMQQAQGAYDKNIAQTPPIETAEVDIQEGLPPVTASQQQEPEQQKGFWNVLKQEVGKPYGGETLSAIKEGAKNLAKSAFTPEVDPIVYERMGIEKPPELIQREEQKKALDQEEINRAQMEPWQVVAYGATDAFANKPELVSQFKEYTGIDFTDQEKQLTEKYEKVLSDIDKGFLENDANYDEQEKRIKERILSNQSTDSDKFYIGLALMMPLIIGGIFGKEAGLGALGGAAQGFANTMKGRIESSRKDEELLKDIQQQRSSNTIKRGELEIEKLKIPSEIKKILPTDEYKDLKGMNIFSFKDPKTGEVVAYGPEVLPDLYMDLNYGNTEKKRDEARKEASKLEEEKAALERANDATSDVIKAAVQLKDPGIFSKILSYALSEDKNGALKKIVRQSAPEILIDGRKQNSAVYIDSKIEQIKDAYRRNEQMRAFTNTVSAHIGQMAENPQYSGLRPQDLIDQMLILRDRGQQFFVDRASSKGFLREPLENKFGKLNRQLYGSLNRKEELNQIERDKQLMHASE